MKNAIQQLIRYGVVGGASNAVGYLLYLVITTAGMEHKLAMTLLYVVGVVQTFIFNKRWSFSHKESYRPAFIRYCISYILGYFINLIGLYFLVDQFGWSHQIVQGSMIFVVAVLLFVIQKFWVFQMNTSSEEKKELNYE